MRKLIGIACIASALVAACASMDKQANQGWPAGKTDGQDGSGSGACTAAGEVCANGMNQPKTCCSNLYCDNATMKCTPKS